LQKILAAESESHAAAAALNRKKEIYTHLHFFACICKSFTASIRLENGVNVSRHAYALRVACQIFNPLFSLPGLAFSVRDVSLDQCGAG